MQILTIIGLELSIILFFLGLALLYIGYKSTDIDCGIKSLLTIAFATVAIYFFVDELVNKSNNNYESTIIELPEEYKLINKNDTLRGYFDKDSVLHIEFNNQRNNK